MLLKRFPTKSGILFYGQLPNVEVLKELENEGVQTIWNLAEELKNMIPMEKSFIKEVISGNIVDFDAPGDVLKFLRQAKHVVSILQSGGKVFIHCYGGHGRTGMALATIKILEGYGPDLALKIANYYSNGPESKIQKQVVKFIAKYLSKDT